MNEATYRHTAAALAALTLMAANCPEAPWRLWREHVDAPPRAADPGDTVTLHWFTWWGQGVSAVTWLSLTQTRRCHREDSIREGGRRGMTEEKRVCGQNPAVPSALRTGSATAPDLPALHQLHPTAPPTAGLPELGKTGSWACPEPASHFQAEHFQSCTSHLTSGQCD